jgi:hypothetical protein
MRARRRSGPAKTGWAKPWAAKSGQGSASSVGTDAIHGSVAGLKLGGDGGDCQASKYRLRPAVRGELELG